MGESEIETKSERANEREREMKSKRVGMDLPARKLKTVRPKHQIGELREVTPLRIPKLNRLQIFSLESFRGGSQLINVAEM